MEQHHTNSHSMADYGAHKKDFKRYFTGFLLCILLTLVPFYATIHQVSSRTTLYALLLICAVLQFLVQVICFLGLHSASPQGKINTTSFIFTGLVTLVIIGGSIWIMNNLNYFMMH